MVIKMSEIIRNERLGEQYTKIKHPSGCTICLCPMKGFATAYAIFAAKYGSIDCAFKTEGDADFLTTPEGIAHYLEHKLFEGENGDAFTLYAKTGASANAYTSFDATAYLFSCSQKFDENLEILLSFVQEPYFTDETVQKEQGIIAQEIKMYDDLPNWRVFFNCLEGMYHSNPVRINIAGTVESIAKIDKDWLYRCYGAFYNLNNMVISIAGNFDSDKALQLCDKLLIPRGGSAPETPVNKEPPTVREKTVREKLPGGIPLFMLGFKLPDEYCNDRAKAVQYDVFIETALGVTSRFYLDAYKSGLINDSFSVGATRGRGFFFCSAEGDAREPEKVCEAVLEELRRLKREGIPEEDFLRVKKRIYGEQVRKFTAAESVARLMMESEFSGGSLYDCAETAANMTYEDFCAILRDFDPDNSCASIIDV